MNFTKILENLKTLDELTRTMIPCDEYEELTKAQILTKINEIRIEVENKELFNNKQGDNNND